jgi:chromosome segregation ATPase
MPEESLEALRHDYNELEARLRRYEALVSDRQGALEREMRAGFQGVNARFDGLESELRFRFEQIDRLEERMDEVLARMGALEKVGDQRHAEIMAQLEKLLARPSEN